MILSSMNEKLVEMALSGLSWGQEITFRDHAETVFDDFEDDPNLSDKENRDRFWDFVNEAASVSDEIVDLGTHIVQKKTVYHVLIIDCGIPENVKTFIKEADAKEYMLDAVRQTILDYEKHCTDWENFESEHHPELLAKDSWENGYFCVYDVEFRNYGGVIE